MNDLNVNHQTIRDDASNIFPGLGDMLFFSDGHVTINSMRKMRFEEDLFSDLVTMDFISPTIILRLLVVCNFFSNKKDAGISPRKCISTMKMISTRETLMNILEMPTMSSFIDMLLVSDLSDHQINNLEYLAKMDPFSFQVMTRSSERLVFGNITMDISVIIKHAKMPRDVFRFLISNITKGLRNYISSNVTDIEKFTDVKTIPHDELHVKSESEIAKSTPYGRLNFISRQMIQLTEKTHAITKEFRPQVNMGGCVAEVVLGDLNFIIPIEINVSDGNKINVGIQELYKPLYDNSNKVYISKLSKSHIVKRENRTRVSGSKFDNGDDAYTRINIDIVPEWRDKF